MLRGPQPLEVVAEPHSTGRRRLCARHGEGEEFKRESRRDGDGERPDGAADGDGHGEASWLRGLDDGQGEIKSMIKQTACCDTPESGRAGGHSARLRRAMTA